MRRVACAAVFLLVCPIALAQMHMHHPTAQAPEDKGRSSPCTKKLTSPKSHDIPGVDKVNWPVTTPIATQEKSKAALAQKFFNQGITEYYGFNFEQALTYFRAAKNEDRRMAMASWGMALAAGPNINLGMDDRCRELAISEMACAVDLANRPGYSTEVERGLINALALRYAGPMTETVAYAVAMRGVWKTATESSYQYRNLIMPNVGALYAEALINMRPWGLYDSAYRKALDTDTVIEVLTKSMDAEPEPVGANHYWIHTMEASEDPGAATHSAEFLNYATPGSETLHPPAVPGAGHLLHMPSHIYFLKGEYARALQSNTDAIKVDREQYEDACKGWYCEYTANSSCPQLYYGHYPSHNHFFRALSAAFSGQSREAVTSACDTRLHAMRFQANEPGLQRYMNAPLMALVMNRNWKAILGDGNVAAEPEPPADCYMAPFEGHGCHIYRAMWHWARGMAYAAGGDLTKTRDEYDAMAIQMRDIVPPGPTGWGNNTAAAVLAIAQSTLQARYTWAGGQCKPAECKTDDPLCEEPCKTADTPCDVTRCPGGCESAFEQAIEHLKLAVTHENALVYDEPPQWFPPPREALGGAYLQVKDYRKANDAFKEELARHAGSPRAIFGRIRALEGLSREATTQKEKDEIAEIPSLETQFCSAWAKADYTMTNQDLWPAHDGGGDNNTIDCSSTKPKIAVPSTITAPSSKACTLPLPKPPCPQPDCVPNPQSSCPPLKAE